MAMSPRYKVHAPNGTYVSSCKNLGAALFLLDGFYPGGFLRDGSWNRKLYNHDGTRGHDLHAMLMECHEKQEAWADANARKYQYCRCGRPTACTTGKCPANNPDDNRNK